MRHFLTLKDFSQDELHEILALSFVHKHARHAFTALVPEHLRQATLRNKNVALIFEKPSTRTRVSFESGINQLGAHAIVLMGKDTQIGRGEPICDTARVLSGMVDMVMIRTFSQQTIEEFARFSAVPVINGLTDMYHPAQVLADMLTMIECGFYTREFASYYARFTQHADDAPTLPESKAQPIIAYVGDGNNMANSWLNCAAILGLELRLATPAGYEAHTEVLEFAKAHASKPITITHDASQAVQDAHVIITDTWISMGQEEQKHQRLKDFAGFCVNEGLMARADSRAIFLHCLPAYRGYEVSEAVIESAQSQVWLEAHNRLYIQQGIMLWLVAQNH